MKSKISSLLNLTLGGIASLVLAPFAFADHCTIPPTSVTTTVTSSVRYDAKSKLYTYSYKLQNSKESLLSIERFIVPVSGGATNIAAPENWGGRYMQDRSPRVNWSTYHSHPPSTNAPPPTASGYRPKYYAVKPGSLLSGFSFQSPNPPGVANFWVEGDTSIPSSTPTSTNDEPVPDCPGWDFDSPKLKSLVLGLTTGPLPPNTVSVKMRVREERGEKPHDPIDPNTPRGNVSVLILAAKNFDPSQIDVTSIKFGPDEAAPISSKLLGSRDDDDRDNEREDWEKNCQGLNDGRDNDRSQDKRKRNLLLVFDVASLGIQCVLDKAVVLTGKTTSGVSIVGGASTKLVGCDVRRPGVHHRSGKKR